jgi:hypothetical protein
MVCSGGGVISRSVYGIMVVERVDRAAGASDAGHEGGSRQLVGGRPTSGRVAAARGSGPGDDALRDDPTFFLPNAAVLPPSSGSPVDPDGDLPVDDVPKFRYWVLGDEASGAAGAGRDGGRGVLAGDQAGHEGAVPEGVQSGGGGAGGAEGQVRTCHDLPGRVHRTDSGIDHRHIHPGPGRRIVDVDQAVLNTERAAWTHVTSSAGPIGP